MSEDQDRRDGPPGELRQFERNRFFQGKLMTARDMETEQAYHAGRFQAVNRLALGSGILRGLTISEIEQDDDDLVVTIEPGMALDGWGRPIVVEHTTTGKLPAPEGDEIYMYLSFDESTLESVPVPDVRGASDREYESNRTVEQFELTYRESPPADDPIPGADTRGSGSGDPGSRARALGDEYHRQHRTPHGYPDDPSILVGVFEREGEDWTESDAASRRDLVYDNEMLYAALVDHLTDTDNPHGGGGAPAAPADDDEFASELHALRTELDELSSRVDTLNRYLMRKSLKDKIRFFSDVAEQFKEHNPEGSGIAQNIVQESKEAMQEEVYDDPEAYREHVGSTLELDINLGEALEESATEASLEHYVESVSELQTALEDKAPVIEIAESQDLVCEAADSLELLYDIVRDE